jgi:hypothetical protein
MPKLLTSALLALLSTTAFAAKKDAATCTAYLLPVEQDQATMNLKMSGLNDTQEHWYRKDGNKKQYEGVCIINADQTGKRIPITDDIDDPNHYLETVTGNKPIYVLGWEEHLIFIPNQGGGGHNAYSANGILYTINFAGGGSLKPLAPVHDTNRTILTSSSVSLLKAAILKLKDLQGNN